MRYVLSLLMLSANAAADEWFPVNTVSDGKVVAYQALAHADKPWRICALLPHAKDKYWWGVSWGLDTEAERLGVRIGIYQAGGYDHLDVQRKQFADCLGMKADAIVLAAISADGLNGDIARAARHGVPVIDLVNGVTSPDVTAKSLVDFADMSGAAARYLLTHAGARPIKMLWFPGPKGAGWVTDAEQGLARALQGQPVELIHAGYAPTALTSQMALVRELLQKHAPDYILGNAVSIEVASNYLKFYGRTATKAIAFYATEPVVELIEQGRVVAAPSDAPVLQARIALDLAVRALEKKPHAKRVGPDIEVLDARNVGKYDFSKIFPPPNQRFVQRALPPE